MRIRPMSRWMAPAAAVVVVAAVGLGAAAAASASGSPDLPPKTVEQLLLDLASPSTTALSGTVALHADLGLPSLPGLSGGVSGSGVVPGDAASAVPAPPSSSPATQTVLDLLAGDHTLRVWADGPMHKRVAVLAEGSETDLIVDGTDVWLWRSAEQQVLHASLPSLPDEPALPEGDALSLFGHDIDPAGLPATPADAVDRLLAAVDPTTEVTVGETTIVAGRDAYQLVVTPRTEGTLVARVVVAVDAETNVPLSAAAYSTQRIEPALSVAFTSVAFEAPGADVFAFTPPAGATVTELPEDVERPMVPPGPDSKRPGAWDSPPDVTVVGEGWARVLVVRPPEQKAQPDDGPGALTDALGVLPRASGDWGSGYALSGPLFSVLVADDGRLAAGAVPVATLEEALASVTP